MTVEIKGDSVKITLTKEELAGLRPGMPYELTTLIGKAEADHDGYAHSDKPPSIPPPTTYGSFDLVAKIPHVKNIKLPGGTTTLVRKPVLLYKFTNPVIHDIVKNQLEKGVGVVTVTGPENVELI